MSAVRLWNGKPIRLAELAAAAGCTKAAIKHRLRTMTPQQAVDAGARIVTAPTFTGEPRRYECQGKRMSVAEMAAAAGCSDTAIRRRMSERGMTPEQAVAAGARLTLGPACAYALNGVPKSITQLAEIAGCERETMRGRLRKGMTPEAAVAYRRPKPRRIDTKPKAALTVALPKPKKSAAAFIGPVIVPANVKRTIAPTFVDRRFAADPQPPSVISAAECRPWAAAACQR